VVTVALNLGGIVRLTLAVKNDLGALANPATATCAITQPDGVIVSPAVTLPPPATGQLVLDFTPSQAGLHQVDWTTSAPTTSDDDVFYAERPGQMLVSVDDAIRELRASNLITSDADREQLQWLCIVATAMVELELDKYVVRRQVAWTGPASVSVFLKGPVISVTNVSIDGGAYLDPTGYLVQNGSLTSRYGWGYSWPGLITVNYVAGESEPNPVARQGALSLIQGLWQTSQQSAHPVFDESSAEAFAVAAMPNLSQLPGFNKLRSFAVA
jgi:hypothetical protein